MIETIKETVITQKSPVSQTETNAPVQAQVVKATDSQSVAYIVYFIFGALEVLLIFRLVLKLMGASVSSGFVSAIYRLSGIFILPFEGIFRRFSTQGVETTSVLEPSTIVAMIVYMVLAWGIVKLVQVSSGEQQPADQ